MIATEISVDSQPTRQLLTQASVKAVKPGPARFVVWDTDCTGLGLRVAALPSTRKTFVARYRTEAGTIREMRAGNWPDMKVDEARKQARKWIAEARSGGDPSLDRKQSRAADTVADLATRFMREHAIPYCKPRTVELYRDQLDRFVRPVLAKVKAIAVTRADVERLHQRIGRKTPTTANRVLQLLAVLFKRAEDWGIRPQHTNPCAGIKRFKEKGRERFLEPDERATLARVLEQTAAKRRGEQGYASPGAVLAIRLLAATGARCGEIIGLTWAMVELDRSVLRLPDSKTGPKVVPLSPQAAELLRAAKPPRVFAGALVCASEKGTPLNNMERVWGSLRKRAGLDDVRLHDLRHSAASDAIAAGVPIAMVGALLGHRSVKTTARYAHLADDVLQAAAAAMGASMEERTRAGTAKVVVLPRARKVRP